MKKLLFIPLCLAVLLSCKNNKTSETEKIEVKTELEQVPDMHTSQIALDWQGTYSGILPCADCEGIEIEVTLNEDNTFAVKRLYLGKDDKYVEEAGTFEWTEDGNNIVLDEKVKGSPTLFKVGENYLMHLNQEGKIIEGELADKYMLQKN
ncbi:MAG: copper resistance protein NlpE [Flavobacteriaceae bacterium]